MRHRWFGSLALSLGILVMGPVGMSATTARGAEPSLPILQPYPPVATPEDRAPAPPAPPSKTPEAPSQTPAADSEAALDVSLDRPVALREEPKNVDSQVKPTGLFAGRSESAFYSPAATFPTARPLPVGPNSGTTLPMPAPVPSSPPPPDVPYTWRQPPTPGSTSTVQNNSSSLALPMPSPTQGTGSVFGSSPPAGSIVSPGVVSSPGVMPAPGLAPVPGSVPAPGVVAGPMGAPLCEGCAGDACCPSTCCDGGCCDGCCGGCGGCWGGCCNRCCFGNHWWGSAEYLLWFIRGQHIPPLLTSGSIADNPPGAVGQPGTTVLYGGQTVANNPYSGIRLRGGWWLDDCHKWGVDLGGFVLGSGANRFAQSSMGTPFLARPFVNALSGAEDIEAVATPNGLTGTFTAVNTFFLYGAEANLRRNLWCGCNWFIDGFVGWRLLGLTESLSMTENLAVVSSANPAVPAGSTFIVHDRFGTSNLFNGGQIGAFGEYRFGKWFVNVRNSIALGGTQQFVNISGSTTTQAPGMPSTTSPGGLLAQPSNIGGHTRSMVSWVEEVGFHLGYQFTPHIGAFVGYNFLYWSSVVRPGDQIDRVVNPNQLPPAIPGGPPRPEFSFNGSTFWVQGVDFGVRIIW